MTFRPRVIASVLLIALVFALTGTAASAAALILGDADSDRDVSILDATAVLRSVAGLKEIDASAKPAADADSNGVIEAIDATLIQRWLANMAVLYPIGEEFEAPTQPPTQRPTDADGWGHEIFRP